MPECTKKKFMSFATARLSRRRLPKRCRPYDCPQCGFVHLTTQTESTEPMSRQAKTKRWRKAKAEAAEDEE